MGLEEFFTSAINRFENLDKKTEKSKKEMKEVMYQFDIAKSYGELSAPIQDKLEKLFKDIRWRYKL